MQENPMNSALHLWLAPWQQAQEMNQALAQSWWQGWQQLAAMNPFLTPLSRSAGDAPGLDAMRAFTEMAGGMLQGLPLSASVFPVAGDPQAARLSLRLELPRLGGLACLGPAEWLQVEAVVAHRQGDSAAAARAAADAAKVVEGEVLPTAGGKA